MSSRAPAGFAIVGWLILASCGGSPTSGSSSGGSSSHPSSSSAGTGGACVNVDPASYDTSCNAASDCFPLQAGSVCDGSCACGNFAANKSGQTRYSNEIGSLRLAACFCPALSIACVNGKCIACGSPQSASCPDAG
jgi:hypothetical protein